MEVHNSQDIVITPQSGLFIQTLLWGVEQEEAKRLAKRRIIQPVYFREWLEYVDPALILKTEKVLLSFASGQTPAFAMKELKKCIVALNKLEDKHAFIGTLEAESLYEKLVELSLSRGLVENETVEIIDAHREW